MDGDDYEFIEKTLEIPESVNGSDQMDEPEDKNRSQRLKHKSDENDYNIDDRVKRSRAGDQSWDSEKERSSTSHYHSFLRDRERTERDRYRSSRELKERDKDRNWTEDNRKERIRDKIKKMDRDRERRKHGHEDEPERDREQEQEKSKGRSHSGRHSGDWVRERSRDRERNPDMEYEDRERQSEIWQRDRESRRSMEKKEEVAEPEADLLRDQRTIFAYQISKRADERDVYEFFTRAGKVRDVRLIMDRNSRRSKGVGYIEFYDVKSVPLAIALSGQPLLGQPVMVKLSEAEKDLAQSTARVAAGATGFIGPYSGGVRKLYVGNLHFNINEDQLRQVFEPFGAVELVKLPFDPETGHSKGYGFVQFAHIEDARAALNLDGQLDIAGRVIKVSAAIKQTGGREIGANAGDFDDDDEGGGPSLGAQSRKLLMQKLDCTGRTSSVAGSLGSQVMNPDLSAPAAPIVRVAPGVSPLLVPFGQIPVPALEGWPTAGLSLPALTVPSIDSIGVPSECLLLKNMFDPKLESLTDFDQDIKDDIEDECSRFGKLKHIYADKKSAGFVYLQFENSESAIAAKRALHGRWFAGKMITATFMVPQDYEVKFLQSK